MNGPDPWRALGAAVVILAVQDARRRGHDRKAIKGLGLPPGQTLASDAIAFLQSEGAADLLLLLDLDPAFVARLALPEPAGRQLALPLFQPRQAPRRQPTPTPAPSSCPSTARRCPGARPGPAVKEPDRPAPVRTLPQLVALVPG